MGPLSCSLMPGGSACPGSTCKCIHTQSWRRFTAHIAQAEWLPASAGCNAFKTADAANRHGSGGVTGCAWEHVCQGKDDLTYCIVTGRTKETSPYSDVLLIIHESQQRSESMLCSRRCKRRA